MKVAVLGCGYWGKNLVRNFRDLGVLSAVVDPSPEAEGVVKALAPEVPLFRDPERVLADPATVALAIATPAATHAEVCCAALQAGKDVFCEKPLALSYPDAARVASLAARSGRILMIGHVLEYHPAVVTLRRLIAEGELGALQYIYSHRLNLGKVRQDENILWSFAPHDIAIILRITGAMPFRVVATGGAYLRPGVYDTTVTQLFFEDGLAAHIFVSWLNPFKEQKLVVIGTRRMVTFDDVRHELALYDRQIEERGGELVPKKCDGFKIGYSDDEPLRCECQAFLDAVRTRKQPLADAKSALNVLRVLEAAQSSLVARGEPTVVAGERRM